MKGREEEGGISGAIIWEFFYLQFINLYIVSSQWFLRISALDTSRVDMRMFLYSFIDNDHAGHALR